MISPKPLIARAMSKLRPIKPFDWSGFPSQILAPASILERSASIALPEEYERVTGAIEGCDLKSWLAEARGGPQPQPPTRRYNLGRSMIADGTIYYNGGYEVLRPGNAHALAIGKFESYGEMQLASVSVTEQFFGHWLTDSSMMLLLAEQTCTEAVIPWTDAAAAWPHRGGYEALLRSPFRQPRLAVVDKLWAVDDKPRNPSRATRLRAVRGRMRQAGCEEGKSRIAVYRGLSGVRRHLLNEEEVFRVLEEDYGFTTIDLSTLSPRDIVKSLSNADLVIGVEGSHLIHAITASNDNALIFTIMPPQRFSPAIKWYTDIINMHFGFTVADPCGENMFLPLDRLHAAMRNVDKSIIEG